MKKTIFLLAMVLIYHLNAFSAELNFSNKKSIQIVDSTQVYNCSMHPEVISDKPGNCPKCGMELSLKKSDTKIEYTCSMHPEVVSNNPGSCSKCGMTLIEKGTSKSMGMGMMHNNEPHRGWMYIAGGTLMILMMGVMFLF
jgi:hypothetical protein